MGGLPVAVDIAKDSFAAAIWCASGGQALGSVPTTPEGFSALAQRRAPLQGEGRAAAVQLVLESTAGDELGRATWADRPGWRVSLPNPKPLRDWAKGIGRRATTDAQDALRLARYAAERQPPARA